MSYNIDTWKLKKLEDLIIPISAFFKHERKDWHPEIKYDGNFVVFYSIMESEIEGTLTESTDAVIVSKIKISGEGSGTLMDWIIEPALKESSGYLEAVCIWEGGDSITRLKVENGVVVDEKIDL